jgi:dephospho-CoA kinase
MYLIGVTGSIAAGKSTVLNHLRAQGHHTIDADKIAHDLLETDDDLWAYLVSQFGDEILDPEGRICRSTLAQVVFSDAEALRTLESRIHPLIREQLVERLARLHRDANAEVVFVEAALLPQLGIDDLLSEVWIVETHAEQQIDRLQHDRHYSAEEAETRIRAVPPYESALDVPTYRIDNSGPLQYTLQRVSTMVDAARARQSEQTRSN